MATKFHSPFRKETFENLVKQWFECVNQHECGSITNLPKRDQLYRVKQLQENMDYIKRYLRDFNKTQILYLDIVTQVIEDTIDLENYLNKNRDKNKRLVLFILEADRLIEERKQLLSSLDGMHTDKNISVIYMFQKNITLPKYTSNLSQYSTLYQNVYIFPLPSPLDSQEFIIQMSERFQTNFPELVKNTIIEACGGFMWLIKQACRYYSQTRNVKNLFTNEGMELRLSILFKEFDSEEQIVLKKVVTKNSDFDSDQLEILRYLKKAGYIRKSNFGYTLTIPILDIYIKRIIRRDKNIINNQGQITVNNVVVNPLFSKRERKLIIFFLSHTDSLISREQTAEIIWDKDYEERYTDWALDQAIKRLRKKISKLGLPESMIKTVKNQGFIFIR